MPDDAFPVRPAATRPGGWHEDAVRRAAVGRALAAAIAPEEVAWFAAPVGGRLVLGQVLGARTRALPGLMVAAGRGLTGKAAANARPEFVDDYFAADSITHDFDRVVADESIARMLAIPVRCGRAGAGVITVGARTHGRFSDRRIDAVAARAREFERTLGLVDDLDRRMEAALARQHEAATAWLREQVASRVRGLDTALAELRVLSGDDPAMADELARLERRTAELGRAVRGPMGARTAADASSVADPTTAATSGAVSIALTGLTTQPARRMP